MGRVTDREIREKLATRGVESLADAELISVVIQEGDPGGSAVELAEKVLTAADGSLAQLGRMDFGRMRQLSGLGVKRAAWLSAALELGRRLKIEESSAAEFVRGHHDVVRIFRPILAGLPHEEFWVVYLTTANRVMDRVRISQGGVSGTVVDYKLIVKRAVELLASSIIMVHNHPSGLAQPSPDDLAVTEQVARAASLFDIALIDHIIISQESYFSFRQEKRLPGNSETLAWASCPEKDASACKSVENAAIPDR